MPTAVMSGNVRMDNLALSDTVFIIIDEEKVANASQNERLEQTTQLFLGLTKAIKKRLRC